MSHPQKLEIIAEIRRIAQELGKAPGVRIFTQMSGIPQHHWYGKIWPRWSDALIDAGLGGNKLQGRFESAEVIKKVVEATVQFGRVPTTPEMKILRRTDNEFPNPKTVSAHFGNRSELIEAVRSHCSQNLNLSHLLKLLPEPTKTQKPAAKLATGWVYLLKSGPHYKVGRSDTLEKRIRQISIALPESVILDHAIETDDPVGIEAYWHRRFAPQRLNGEWFKLGTSELSAFRRRKFQ